jgi:outer membrane protein assembly factor BamB
MRAETRLRALAAVLVVTAACRAAAPPHAAVPPSSHGRAPEPYDQPGEAQEFYALKRAPVGQKAIPTQRYLAAKSRMRAMRRYSTRLSRFLPRGRAEASAAAGALGVWTPLGPGNVGGRTRRLVIHPTVPSTMYAGGVSGGVWKTTNGGGTWVPLDDFMANLAVSSLVMDPGNSSVLYAGTGEGFFNSDAVRGAGIFKTTNAGATWNQLANTANSNFHYVNDLIVSTNNSQRVYAATRNAVWRSLDGGANWSPIFNGSGFAGGCLDLLQRPGGPNDEIFAACGTINGNSVIVRSPNADGAASFATVLTQALMARTSLAIAPSDPNVLYALSASSGSFNQGLEAVFRSTDGGLNWTTRVTNGDLTKLNTVLLTNPIIAFLTECSFGTSSFLHQGWYDNVIAVDPTDPDKVWVGGIDLFRSDDGGANWGLASYWWDSAFPQYAHADQHAIVFHPGYDGVTNRTMFVGNDGGLFRTDNAQAAVATGPTAACNPNNSSVTWTELNNNYGVTQFYYGVPYPGGDKYFGGTQDNGTVRGTDASGSEAWVEVLGGDGGAVAVDPTNTNVLYVENTGLSIQKSTNGGLSFFPATTGITNSGFLFIAPFVMDPGPGGSQRLWTGGSALWRTTDGATSWVRASVSPVGTDSVTAIAVAPSSGGNVVLAGTRNGFIHRTAIGLTATTTTVWPGVQPVVGAYLSGLGFHPTNANIAYATYSTFGPGIVHVWKTTDGGATWSDADGSGITGIPDIPCHSVVVDPVNPSRVYVGTDLGVFVSLDAGATWAVENTGFANVVTESLSREGTKLFAFTHGRGAYRVTAEPPTLSVDDVALAEGNSGSTNAVFTVTLSTTWSVDVGVNFATANVSATAGTDYTLTSGNLVIPAGSLTGTISVPVLGDIVNEGADETFNLNLTAPTGGATLLDTQGVGTIQEDDPVPTVSLDDVEVMEGNGGSSPLTFTISLSNPSAFSITVPYATANGSALAPGDYQTVSSSVVFAPGVVTQPVPVLVNGDLTVEPDESFFLNLSPPPANAVLNDAQGVGTIRNDDALPADDVVVFTIRATSGESFLEWVNPGPPYVSTLIHRNVASPACAFPTDPNPLAPTFIAEVSTGGANGHGTYSDTAVTDGTTYCYTAFVKRDNTPTYSTGRNAAARPFVTTAVKWAYTTAASAVAPPGLGVDAVYAVSNDRIVHGMLRGVGTESGKWPPGSPGWRPFLLGGPAQSRPPVVPASPADKVLVGSQDGFAYAIDADLGTQIWQTLAPLGDDVQGSLAGLFQDFGAPFDVIMVGSRTPGADNVFYGLDPDDGGVIWQYAGEASDKIGIINSGAAVQYASPQRVYFASRERSLGKSTLWCLDVTGTGATLKWKKALGSIDGGPVLRAGVVYVGTNAGFIYALDAEFGNILWSFDASGDGPVKGFLVPDRQNNQDLFFSTTTKVWGIRDNGGSASRLFDETTVVPSPSTPVHPAGSKILYLGGADGLYQVDYTSAGFPTPVPIVTSVPLGAPPGAAVGAPTYDALLNVIYVGTVEGILYAVVPPIP